MSDRDANAIHHDRFYICDNGDGSDAFMVCGQCVEESDRNPELYDELHPTSKEMLEQGFTRVCVACDRNAWEVEHGE